jgi:hypothetical protein
MGILRCIRGVGDPNSRTTLPCIQRVFERVSVGKVDVEAIQVYGQEGEVERQ